VNQLRHPGLSVKLGLVVLGIVAGALTIVYLSVVPRLEDRLIADRISELKASAEGVRREFSQSNPADYGQPANEVSTSLGARVVVLQRLGAGMVSLGDSNAFSTGNVEEDPIALRALSSGEVESGTFDRAGLRAEVAIRFNPDTVVLLSASLRDSLASVALVKRSLLVSGIVALVIAWFAGSLAAFRLTNRIHRLETAAGRIAGGDFEQEVSDPVEDELGDLARAFDRMRLRLAHLDRARREFIANASHELRTPLFSLGGFLELMADEDVDPAVRMDFVDEKIGRASCRERV